jgi:hypothetical protein
LSLIAPGFRRRVRECLRKKACHRRSCAPATAGYLFPRMRWPSKPPVRERSWRSMNRRLGAVVRDQDLPALFKSSNTNGSERSRLPVAAKIAFETAGAMGGTPGSPRRLVRFSDMKVHGWHIRQAQWLISIENGLIDYTIGQCVGAGIDLRLCLFAASPTERGGTSPKFQHSSGADVSPVLSSASACRADSDPVRTHDGATLAAANRSAIELTKRRGFFAGGRSRLAGPAPS